MERIHDCVGLVSCSDGLAREQMNEICRLKEQLSDMGLSAVESPYLYRKDTIASGTPSQRAGALMELYRDPQVQAIFDVSGGNLANQVLDNLDYQQIRDSGREFWGYSDLTVLLNAIYAMTGNSGWLYQIRMLTGSDGENQRHRFRQALQNQDPSALLPQKWDFLQGEQMQGILLGGNIRCFMKLAGTRYFPDLTGKVLFLESLGGGRGIIASLLAQLSQTGAFHKICGLLLGTFTQLDREEGPGAIEELVQEALEASETAASGIVSAQPVNKIPVARTFQAGHGEDSHALPIGRTVCLDPSGFSIIRH